MRLHNNIPRADLFNYKKNVFALPHEDIRWLADAWRGLSDIRNNIEREERARTAQYFTYLEVDLFMFVSEFDCT